MKGITNKKELRNCHDYYSIQFNYESAFVRNICLFSYILAELCYLMYNNDKVVP